MDNLESIIQRLDFHTAVWLCPVAFVVHVLEELPGFTRWVQCHINPGFTQRQYLAVHAGGILFTAGVAFLISSFPDPYVVFLCFTFAITPTFFANTFFHAGASIIYRSYSPGVTTALVLYPPLYFTLCRLAVSEQLLTWQTWIVSTAVALGFHFVEVRRNVLRARDFRTHTRTALALALLLLGGSARADSAPRERTEEVVRLDSRFDSLVPRDARLEKIADGFTWVEGPVWHRDGYLLFSDIPSNAVFKWSDRAGVSQYLTRSGYSGSAPFIGREPGSNGLALDASGRLILCEHGDRRITRLESDRTKTVLVDRYDGKRLNSPNDVLLGANGDLYFTDPPFGLPNTFDDPHRELPFSGVYRLAANGRLTLLTADLRAPNGIALSPAGDVMYVTDADPKQPRWMAFDVRADGTLAAKRLFFDATNWAETYDGSADGMKVDKDGHLFAAGPGGIFVLAPDGTLLGRIVIGVATSNCAWGGNGSVLYITAGTAIYRIRTTTRGLAR